MRLRNEKIVNNIFDTKRENKLIDLVFDIIFISNNINLYSNREIKYQTINNYCEILFYEFKNKLYHLYGVKKISFECDYLTNNNKNVIHIKKILNIVNKFFKSDLYNLRIEEDLKIYLNKCFYYNENIIKNNLKCSYILALIFFYFQMVIIETLYDECLSWNGIRHIFEKFTKSNKHLNNYDVLNISDFIQFAVNLCDDMIINDNEICSKVRRYIMCI